MVRSVTEPPEALAAPGQSFRFQRSQTLFHCGDAAQSLYRLQDGLIRITRMTPEGRTMTVRHVLPGDFFGEDALTSAERTEVAEAVTSATIKAFDPALIQAGDLLSVTRSLSEQIKRHVDYEYHLHTGDLRTRVARYLLQLADTPLATLDHQGRPLIAATRDLLAEGTASTRESVSKVVVDFRNEGLLEAGYRYILLRDSEALGRIAESL